MHEGEQLYTFNWQDHVVLLIIVAAWLVLIFTRRAPTADSWRAFVNVLDSRGGNILILVVGTFYSFRVAMRLFYHLIGLLADGKLDEKSAIVLMGLTFVTGTVFGQFSGALMKTMHGTDVAVPPVNGAPGVAGKPAVPTSATPPLPGKADPAIAPDSSSKAPPAGWGKA